MFKALLISLFMLFMSLGAKAAQCDYSVEVDGRVVASFMGESAEECKRAYARCQSRSSRIGGICVQGRGAQVPPRTTRPTRPRPEPRPNPYPTPTPSNSIRVGDKVYPETWTHSLGAQVLQYNYRTGEYRVKSNQSGSVFTFTAESLSVSNGCVESVCVTDKVFPENWTHSLGAQVLAQNPIKQTLMVRSNQSGSVFTFTPENLLLAEGCTRAVCVGDRVFPLNWTHGLGAKVIAMSSTYTSRPSEVILKVQSNQSGTMFSFTENDIAIGSGCLDGFCVGQRVYPRNWTHSLGASVLAINRRQGKLVVKSNQSGTIFTFTSYDL